jgi:hypothetical protein
VAAIALEQERLRGGLELLSSQVNSSIQNLTGSVQAMQSDVSGMAESDREQVGLLHELKEKSTGLDRLARAIETGENRNSGTAAELQKVQLKDPFKATTGLSVGGLFILLAMNGESFWKGMGGAWDFLLTISKTAPLGVASFFLALTFATLTVIALKRVIPDWRNSHSRSAQIETIGILVGVGLSWYQVQRLQGILFGLLAGFMAGYVARIVMALATWAGNVLTDRKDVEVVKHLGPDPAVPLQGPESPEGP